MLKKLLSVIVIFAISISPVFAKEFEGFYYYYYLPENGSFNHYETRSGKTTVDEAISQAIQKGEYHELETLLETSRVDPKTAEKIVELVKKNKLKEAEELFETGHTSASEFVSETSTSSWTGFRYDYGSNVVKQSAKNISKSAKDAKKLNNGKAYDLAKERGFKNAHDLKKYAVKGQRDTNISHYNMYYNSKTKELFLQHNSTGKFIKID
ncbi:MAG: hypothetical protein IJR46_00080 [Neisseriaceae bacterium]|nr:hypothetical protein [Neisseriaceae bacterium]